MSAEEKEALRLKIGAGTQEEAMDAFEKLMTLHMNEYEGGEM